MTICSTYPQCPADITKLPICILKCKYSVDTALTSIFFHFSVLSYQIQMNQQEQKRDKPGQKNRKPTNTNEVTKLFPWVL